MEESRTGTIQVFVLHTIPVIYHKLLAHANRHFFDNKFSRIYLFNFGTEN